jgi:hypothetical protein
MIEWMDLKLPWRDKTFDSDASWNNKGTYWILSNLLVYLSIGLYIRKCVKLSAEHVIYNLALIMAGIDIRNISRPKGNNCNYLK